MSSNILTIEIGFDTDELDFELEQADENIETVRAKQVAAIRQISELTVLTLQALGANIDASFRALIDLVLISIETVLTVQGAIAAGNPVGAILAGAFGLLQIGALVGILVALQRGRSSQAAQLQSAVSLARMGGGVATR